MTGRVGLPVARLGGVRRAGVRLAAAHPREVIGVELARQEQRVVVSLHDDELVLLQVLAAHVPRPACRILQSADPDALPLPYGVEGKADVLADGSALGAAHR